MKIENIEIITFLCGDGYRAHTNVTIVLKNSVKMGPDHLWLILLETHNRQNSKVNKGLGSTS
jgi:hypothetical protein